MGSNMGSFNGNGNNNDNNVSFGAFIEKLVLEMTTTASFLFS